MKKSLLVIAAAAAVLAACSSKDSVASASAGTDADAPAADEFNPTTNIRYYDLDSVQKYYKLAEEAQEFAQALQTEYNQYEYNMGMAAQKEAQQFQEKLQGGQFTSEAEAQTAYNTVQRNGANYQQRVLNKQNEIAEQLAAKQKELADSLNNFLTVYNNKHHYDAIIVKTPGDHFNPKLDITQEVIKGLNERYKAKAAKEEAADTKAEKKATAKETAKSK